MLLRLGPATDTDAELLARFAAGRCDDAFAALVRRYGPMVLGVCRRILGDSPDADDAFQATFLVLARKAGTLADPARLPGFLYGVAYRTAMHARNRRSRRWKRESFGVPDLPAPPPSETGEVFAVLDREVNELPPKYRDAVALVDLAGLPRPTAAERLAVPEGTLSSRLAEGRKRLAGRLTRLGFAPAIVAAVAVPETLSAAPASTRASLLALGVTRAMTPWKLPVAAALLVAGFGLTAGMSAAPPTGPSKNPIVAVIAAPVASAADNGPGQNKVADAPPVVLKTVPAAGTEDVDAEKVKEIRVTFSKAMRDKSWSWASDKRFGLDIESAGEIAYNDAKTACVMPCKLKPKTTYAVWLNSDKFQNFLGADGTPALPYLLVFRTK